jgi:hypothetical protein
LHDVLHFQFNDFCRRWFFTKLILHYHNSENVALKTNWKRITMNVKGLDSMDLRIGLLFATALVFVIALSKLSPPSLHGPVHHTGKYDTDPNNDRYIKGDMNPSHIKLFNKVLCAEKKQNGKWVSGRQIRKIVGHQNFDAVNAAYKRWQECKDQNRNKDHVIYPPNCS